MKYIDLTKRDFMNDIGVLNTFKRGRFKRTDLGLVWVRDNEPKLLLSNDILDDAISYIVATLTSCIATSLDEERRLKGVVEELQGMLKESTKEGREVAKELQHLRGLNAEHAALYKWVLEHCQDTQDEWLQVVADARKDFDGAK